MKKPTRSLTIELNSLEGKPYTQEVFLNLSEWEVVRLYCASKVETRGQIYDQYAKYCEGSYDCLVVYLMGYIDGLNPMQAQNLLNRLENTR